MEINKMGPVLFITPFFKPNIGGVESRLDEITKALVRNNVKVYVLTFQPLTTKGVRGKAYEIKDGVTIWRFPWIGANLFHKLLKYPVLEVLYLGVPLFIYSLYILLRYRKRLNIRTVHSAGLVATLCSLLLKRLFGFRLISTTHAIYNFENNGIKARIVFWVMSQADSILAIGRLSREELIRIGISPAKISIQPTWTNQDIFKPLPADNCKKELCLSGYKIFGFIGRLNENKGVKLLLDLAKYYKNDPQIVFIFVGTGDLETLVEEKSKGLPNIKFFGKVENYHLARYYNAIDCFMSLALYEEGFSRSVVEALSCGIPVLASNKGCLPEIIRDRFTGWLIEPSLENAKKYIEIISKIPDAEMEIMKGNCYRFSREEYSPSGVEEFIKAYGFRE